MKCDKRTQDNITEKRTQNTVEKIHKMIKKTQSTTKCMSQEQLPINAEYLLFRNLLPLRAIINTEA